jgi:hypothetical protein
MLAYGQFEALAIIVPAKNIYGDLWVLVHLPQVPAAKWQSEQRHCERGEVLDAFGVAFGGKHIEDKGHPVVGAQLTVEVYTLSPRMLNAPVPSKRACKPRAIALGVDTTQCTAQQE